MPVLFGGNNLPPLVEIELTDLPKSGDVIAPPGATGLLMVLWVARGHSPFRHGTFWQESFRNGCFITGTFQSAVKVHIINIYSEKATQFFKNFTFLLSYVVPVKSKVKILQNFVASSQYQGRHWRGARAQAS